MNKSKGFTIIELIVVIAIIAVLAAIVLVNVTSYINKGKDAAIKGNMAQMATQAATIYAETGSYSTLETQPNFVSAVSAITNANSAPLVGVTAITYAAYCVEATLKDATIWCVDSTGYVGLIVSTHCASGTPSCK